MARAKSTACPVGGIVGSGSEDRRSRGSDERTESAQLSDVSSHGEAGDVVDGSRSFLFGPSTVTVSRIHGMIDSGYFVEGTGRETGEDTIS
jgi:hypothetical protein